MSAILRISGTTLDVDRVIGTVVDAKVQRIWRTGESSRLGPAHATSGINLLLSDSERATEMVVEAAGALSTLGPLFTEFMRQGATAELDFGIFVSAMQSMSIAFEPAILRIFEIHKLRVVVSAYPVSEDDE
jgi:hypothetical protein